MPSTTPSLLGASASTAGDDFHELWAMQKILQLMDPQSDLISVVVEGVPDDQRHAEIGEHGQAVDVTEVRATPDGEHTTYEQLKYSSTHPDLGWTWGRLFSRRVSSRPETSVIGKLARLYAASTGPRTIRLVTNQPLPPQVAKDFAAFPALLRGGAGQRTEDLERLVRETGLAEPVLADFLDAFDLGGFGSATRLRIQTALIRTLGGMNDADARTDLTDLQAKVSGLIMPENRNHPPVDRETLLAWLGAGGPEFHFPAPSDLHRPRVWVERDVTANLVSEMIAPDDRLVRLLAEGGCGKTSFMTMLPDYLPPGSETILFDCYGGGLFLSSAGRRHLPQQTFVQVANELAGRLGSPFVLQARSGPELTGRFLRRVEAAAALLAERSPDGRLVLVFDAADNARIAADRFSEPCFIDELTAIHGWPDNVRVILTCRPGRKASLGPDSLFKDLVLEPFRLAETTTFVALEQPDWSPKVAAELHDLTGGTPRRLAYAVEDIGADRPEDAVARLMPRASGMDPLFRHRVKEAGQRVGDDAAVDRMLCALAVLPRPMPGWVLADTARVAEGDIPGLANDLGGLVRTPQGWSFQDEDFEAFAGHNTQALAPTILARACEVLAARQGSDPYAARALAEAYLAAGNTDALFDLAQSDPRTIGVADEGERRAVQMRRIALSLRAARKANDPLQAQTLLLTASKAVRVQRLTTQTLTGNLDLAADLSSDEAFRQVAMGSKRRAARGELRLRLALGAADPAEARHHLRWWHAWAADVMTSDAGGRGQIGIEHLVLEFEAHRRLGGIMEAVDRLLRWSPKEYVLKAADRLIGLALDDGRDAEIDEALALRRWPRGLLFSAAAQRLQRGRTLKDDALRPALEHLSRTPPIRSARIGHDIDRWATGRALLILEAAAARPSLQGLVLDVLDRWWPRDLPANHPPGTWVLESGDVIARAAAVRESLTGETIALDSLVPELKPLPVVAPLTRGQTPDAAHLEAMKLRDAAQRFNAAREGDLTQLRALLDRARRRLIEPGAPALDVLLDPPQRRYEHIHGVAISDAALARLHACDIVRRADRGFDVVRAWIQRGTTPTERLERLTLIRMVTGEVAAFADDLVAVQTDLAAETVPASSKIESLIACARLAKTFDEALTRLFYNQALAVIGELDLEAVEYLVAAANACETAMNGSQAARRTISERLAVTAEAVRATLGDEVDDYMPWDAILSGCAAQDPPTALAVLGRWRDDAYVPLDMGLPALICETALGQFPPVQQRALRRMAHAQALPGGPERADVELYVAEAVTRDAPSELQRVARRVAALPETVRRGRWARGLLAAVGTLRTEPERAVDEAPTPSIASPIGNQAELVARLDALPAGAHLTASELEDLAAGLTSPGLRLPLLRELAARFADEWVVLNFFAEVLPAWRAYPPVAAWARDELGDVISRGLRWTLGGSYRETSLLETLLAQIEGPGRKLEVILCAVERYGEDLAPEIMITLAGLVAKLAREDQRLGLVAALIDHTVASLGGAPVPQPPSAPNDLNTAFARWLFALMADVDKRVRWRASHAARDLIGSDSGFASAFVALLTRTDERVFAKESAFFYLQAARLQVAVVLHRVAIEQPAALAPHAAAIAAAALAEPAHVLIRHFLKEAALVLEHANPGTYGAAELASLQALNVVTSRRASGRMLGRRQQRARRAQSRYDFDDTDTTPYWFSPAAAPFQIDLATFETMAERWICDIWQAPIDASRWPCDPRVDRFRHADYNLTSHRHGSEPVLERLARYLDWHAMFCVVGELVATRPQVVSQWSETFEDWLADHALTEPRSWVADLLGPPPTEARHWRLDPAFEQDEAVWLDGPESSVPSALMHQNDRLVVAEVSDVTGRDRNEHVRIYSALVTPETAPALAAALETARSSMDFRLPDAGEDRFATDEPGFEFEGWLSENQREARLDATDPARRSVQGMPVFLSDAVQHDLGLTYDADAQAWHTADGVNAFQLKVWDRSPHDGSGLRGWRLTIDRDSLASVLAGTGRSLLVEVAISRRMTGDYDAKRRRTRWRMFVIDGNLQVTSVSNQTRAGRYWVRRLGLEPGCDTLARWLVHRICELDAQRQALPGCERRTMEAEMSRLAVRLGKQLR